jgi:hypothetical protein
MTFNETIRIIQEKYGITEHDAIEILSLERYKRELQQKERHD